MSQSVIAAAGRIVVKVGSALVTNDGRGLDHARLARWAEQIAALGKAGKEVVLVSSGAIAEGMLRLGWSKRPHALNELQAAAAVGQMGLVEAYERCFRAHGLHTAQVLLTHADLADRERYLNARTTLRTLLALKVIPIINENDTVTTDEIKVGDNDTLGALVANLIEADTLVLLTDQQGLYDADPRTSPHARLVREATAGDPGLLQMAGPGGELGRGGMQTKLGAAERAARSGTATVIAYGREPRILERLHAGEAIGTRLVPARGQLAARKQWLAGQMRARGRLHLDDGAARMLHHGGKSLLPVGVKRVEGVFQRGELVACLDPAGKEIARGLVNYSAEEAGKIAGRPSREIEKLLGYVDEPELIHRDNMVVSEK
jgi:glutamate 5-kinase